MPDLWMDVDTALSEVPICKGPLIDDTDFKTREESVVYNQAGLDLVWNFVTTGGAFTQTAVTPTDTAGNYDWVNQGNGLYTIEIPASGGASINNDTEGFGWFSGFATGILPWIGPTIGFRAAALNNALVDGGDALDVNVTLWLDSAPDALITGLVSSRPASISTSARDLIVDQVWDELQSAHTTAGSFGEIATEIAAILVDTAEIGAAGAGLTALATQASVDAVPTAAEINAEVVDALATDTYAEPGQETPAATTTLANKIGYLFKMMRNKKEQTATVFSLYDDAGTTVDQKSDVSDDGTTATRAELVTGP